MPKLKWPLSDIAQKSDWKEKQMVVMLDSSQKNEIDVLWYNMSFEWYSKICDIWYWIIQKSLLICKLTKSFKWNKERLTVLCCANAAARCYISSGEKD
jgi:hypothetical protein